MHFASKRQHFLKELDHSTRNLSDPFVVKPNKLLVLQVNDSCMPFISHNPYIFFLSIFDVGSVSEKNFFFASLGPLGVKIEA